MATLIDGIMPCVDPTALYNHCVAATPPIPTDWIGQANLFRIPLGRGPGTGGVLLKDFQLSELDTTIDHTLTFLDSAGQQRTLQKITIVRGRDLTPGAPVNDHGTFLCTVVDRRFHLARIPVNKAYNVAAGDGLSYLAQSLNGGSAWTWQGMVQDLATTLGLGTMTLPFTPHGTPENFTFWAGFAWDALNRVVDRLACRIKYDPEADTFTILRQGDAAAAAAVIAAGLMVTLAGRKIWDDYHNEPYRGRLPEKIRVTFSRRPQPTDGSSPFYTYDVTLPATAGVEAGTFEQLHDDLTAVGLGVPTNAASLAARANERATDWLRKRVYNEARTTIIYRDFQEGMKLLAETTGAVAYDDRGGIMGTELSSGPDGLMEAFRPYEQPFVLVDSAGVVLANELSGGAGPVAFTVVAARAATLDGAFITFPLATPIPTTASRFCFYYIGYIANLTGAPITVEYGLTYYTGAAPASGVIYNPVSVTVPASGYAPMFWVGALDMPSFPQTVAPVYRGSGVLFIQQFGSISAFSP